ncbi:MAG TPA: hypothetical protein VFH15_10480 [Pyrinomonadaceae bacterium]|nr:hypothetical protein [Pyrinomonadaceae bacterium]
MQRINSQRWRLSFFALAPCLLAVCVQAVNAQEAPVVQQPSAPPPAKVITKEDRARVTGAKDDKARLRVTIEIAEAHLADAETRSAAEDFDAASASLGKYHALIEDALAFLGSLSREQNRTRDLYKRLELALRGHGPRLTAIRRTTPIEYAVWVKKLEEFARKGRTEALNSFYGNTVLKDPQSKVENEKSSKKPQEPTPTPDN